MNANLIPETQKAAGQAKQSVTPSVTLIVSFEPKMNSLAVLKTSQEAALAKVSTGLKERQYSVETIQATLNKLRQLFSQLNYETHFKSVVITTGNGHDQVFYLNTEVEEAILLDKHFTIVDVLQSKRKRKEYLLLLADERQSNIYLGRQDKISRIVSLSRNKDDGAPGDHRPFIRRIDNSLGVIIAAWHLPLLFAGSGSMAEQFGKYSRHAGRITKTIGEEVAVPGLSLKELSEKIISEWSDIERSYLEQEIAQAAREHRLVQGTTAVFREAMRHRMHLLVIEKNFLYAVPGSPAPSDHVAAASPRVTLDTVMERVLENGGDVVFAESGLLLPYGNIVLLTF